MAKKEFIKVKNMTKNYNHDKGVFDFSFKVKEGEVFGLVGTNGSGKTTTIRQMMGFIKSDSGKIEIMGMDAWKKSNKIKKYVGYVPGQIDFPDVGTGKSFLKIQADMLGLNDLTYMNELIDRLKIDISAPLRRMSKGMKQKMALVVAFMAQPDIYILDEPSTGLDPLMRDTLIKIILEQKALGKTIFMSSHIFKEMEDTCDTVMFIHNGRLIDIVTREDFEKKSDDSYVVNFSNREDFKNYISANQNHKNKKEIIISKNSKKNQLILNLLDQSFDFFFENLSHYSIGALSHERASLEKYYKNNIESMEVTNNA